MIKGYTKTHTHTHTNTHIYLHIKIYTSNKLAFLNITKQVAQAEVSAIIYGHSTSELCICQQSTWPWGVFPNAFSKRWNCKRVGLLMIDVVSVNLQEQHQGYDRRLLHALTRGGFGEWEQSQGCDWLWQNIFSPVWDSLMGRCEEASAVWEGENYIVGIFLYPTILLGNPNKANHKQPYQ